MSSSATAASERVMSGEAIVTAALPPEVVPADGLAGGREAAGQSGPAR
jgi:hypothetical protein